MRVLIPIIFIVGMGWCLFFHPSIFVGFGHAMLMIGFGFFAAVSGFIFYAQYRQKKGNPIKGVTIGSTVYTPAAYVGLQGKGVRLLTKSSEGKLRIRLSSASYTFIIAICFFFGPGMIGAYAFHGSHFLLAQAHGKERIAVIGVVTMVGISTLLFFYYLRIVLGHMPAVEITPESIRLMRGITQESVILQHDIENFDIRTSQFDAGGDGTIYFIDNYTLCVVLSDGTVKGLCITDNKDQIETLKRGLEGMMNVPAAPLSTGVKNP